MPTERYRHIRHLLRRQEATVVSRIPFVVRFATQVPADTQPLILGIDPGYTIGIAVITPDGTPVLLAELITRSNTIPTLMQARAESRHSRRQHQRDKRKRRAIANGTIFQEEKEFFATHEISRKLMSRDYPGEWEELARSFQLPGKHPKTKEPSYNPLRCHTIKPKLARFHNRKNKEACYRLTDDTIQILLAHDVPQEIIMMLEPLYRKKFSKQNEFLKAVRDCLGKDMTKQYKYRLLACMYKDWVAPTVEHFENTHKRIIQQICTLVPITHIVIEYASFDPQKMENPEIQGEEYQQGPRFGWGYENIKQFVLERDDHICQLCKKRKPYLYVHHVIWRRVGGADTQHNLATICMQCHEKIHTSSRTNTRFVKECQEKGWGRIKVYQKTSIFNIMMPRFYTWLRYECALPVQKTYGYITKWYRKQATLDKTHANDAYIIALRATPHQTSSPAIRTFPVFQIFQERRHDRKLITRTEDRKYKMQLEDGKKPETVAKNRRRRTGQDDYPGLNELREQYGEKYISQLSVTKAARGKSSKFKGINKGDLVFYKGELRYVLGYASYGRSVYLEGEKTPDGKKNKPISTKQCTRFKRNSGIVWTGYKHRSPS